VERYVTEVTTINLNASRFDAVIVWGGSIMAPERSFAGVLLFCLCSGAAQGATPVTSCEAEPQVRQVLDEIPELPEPGVEFGSFLAQQLPALRAIVDNFPDDVFAHSRYLTNLLRT
jgi:hypothetical protein